MRILHIPATGVIVGALVLVVPASWGQKPPKPKNQPAPKTHPNTGPGGGPPAPRRASDEQVDKLAKMSPAEREKALSSLPPERRVRIETRLEKLKNMTPEQKAQLEKFHSLPPEQQQKVRQLSQRIQALPADRKMAVQKELKSLKSMPDDEREKRVNSPDFQKKFSPDEQEILREAPRVVPQNFF
jgi:hypothetical protein